MYYFYCPHCGKEYDTESLPYGTIVNIRDGYGEPIRHYECTDCQNLDAGFMRYRNCEDQSDMKKYYQSVIKKYQGIRGFKR